MIKHKIIYKLPSSKAAISIKSDPGDAISGEPLPLSQSLSRIYRSRKIYASGPAQGRDLNGSCR